MRPGNEACLHYSGRRGSLIILKYETMSPLALSSPRTMETDLVSNRLWVGGRSVHYICIYLVTDVVSTLEISLVPYLALTSRG